MFASLYKLCMPSFQMFTVSLDAIGIDREVVKNSIQEPVPIKITLAHYTGNKLFFIVNQFLYLIPLTRTNVLF